MGNPHVVVEVEDVADAGPLLAPPALDPVGAANVEFVQTVAPGHLRMRVHERGSGETQSCGTGACAAAVAAAVRAGETGGRFVVDVPGGRLLVAWDGLDRSQAARSLDMTKAQFAVRLHRARRRLQHTLDAGRHPHPCSEHSRSTSEVS